MTMNSLIPSAEQMELKTPRLILEPVRENHAREFWELFQDPELHRYVPSEVPTLAQQTERCIRWANRISPDGNELWLNWLARDNQTGVPVGHFQAGVKSDRVASIGYVVGRAFQGKGFATEAAESVFRFLRKVLAVREIKAWTDTRNEASHRLARKLGMTQVEFIKDADHFKGSTSDEFVFSKVFE